MTDPTVDDGLGGSVYPSLEAALAGEFAGVDDEIIRGIGFDAQLIARWSGLEAVDVVRMLGCLESWDLATRCRICGCSDEQACERGCVWVEDPAGLGDLCSSCLADAALDVEESHAG